MCDYSSQWGSHAYSLCFRWHPLLLYEQIKPASTVLSLLTAFLASLLLFLWVVASMLFFSTDFYLWEKDVMKSDFRKSDRCAFEEFWPFKFLFLCIACGGETCNNSHCWWTLVYSGVAGSVWRSLSVRLGHITSAALWCNCPGFSPPTPRVPLLV